MTSDEELRRAVDALAESVLALGAGATGRAAASRVTESDVGATAAADAPDAVVLAVDAGEIDGQSPPDLPTVPDAVVRIAAITVPDRPEAGEQALLETLSGRVDTVVLASGTGVAALADAVATLVSIVHESGIVNVDLADVATVFRSTDLAVLCTGSGALAEPTVAVEAAVRELPAGIETDPVRGALVDLIGPAGMTVADINDSVSAVRGRVGPDAHVIWGGAIDDTLDELRVRLVLAGVKNVRVAAGDRCPRCGSALSTYRLDGRGVPSCESCGFAGVSVRLRD
jgi:hypothetical protein